MSEIFNIEWSPEALSIIKRFLDVKPYWTRFAQSLSYRLGQEAVEHIKPMTHVSAYYRGNEALASSLDFHTDVQDDGFTVTFNGLWYGNLMDIGNWNPGSAFYRINRKAWPVGLRTAAGDYSQVTWAMAIHGMGHTTAEAPTHFSEKTAQWLADNMNTFCDQYLTRMLEELVRV